MYDVMIVEDDPAFLQQFSQIVTSTPDFNLFATATTGKSALQAMTDHCPDVLLVDLGLPDMDGVEIIRYAAQRFPGLNIMVFTIFGDEAHVLRSIEAGASGYILKDSLPKNVIELIRQLLAGGSPISPLIARQLLNKFRPYAEVDSDSQAKLTVRETEVLTLLAKGFSFGEIARLLNISPHTVPSHIKKIYGKLAVHSRGEAVYEASKLGLLR